VRRSHDVHRTVDVKCGTSDDRVSTGDAMGATDDDRDHVVDVK